MRERVLRREQDLDVGIERAFAFFSQAENLEAITPPWLRFRIVSPGPLEMRAGTLIHYRLRLHGIPVSWLTRIDEWDPPRGFVDRQVRGPYRLWHHTHGFEPLGPDRTRMVDIVRYAHRFGPIGTVAEALVVERDLARIFDFRSEQIRARILASGS
jgi:ligand-binding SRPBCC domain-containing protein